MPFAAFFTRLTIFYAGEWQLAEDGKHGKYICYKHAEHCVAPFSLKRNEFNQLPPIKDTVRSLSGPSAKTQLTASTGLNQKLRTVQRYVLEDCVQGKVKDIAHKISVLPSLLDETVKINPGSTYHIDVDEEEDDEGE